MILKVLNDFLFSEIKVIHLVSLKGGKLTDEISVLFFNIDRFIFSSLEKKEMISELIIRSRNK